jgi:hypothetical protein
MLLHLDLRLMKSVLNPVSNSIAGRYAKHVWLGLS